MTNVLSKVLYINGPHAISVLIEYVNCHSLNWFTACVQAAKALESGSIYKSPPPPLKPTVTAAAVLSKAALLFVLV